MTIPIDYDGRQSAVYAQGRALAPRVVGEWMDAFTRNAPVTRPLAVLDLGSGTGRFTPALARTFGGLVYGVEPSAGMRRVALEELETVGVGGSLGLIGGLGADTAGPDRHQQRQAVSYLEGSAQHIPLPDTSVELVLLFLVWHHVPDTAAAAAEVRRVLKPGGRVLMRQTFRDRLPEDNWRVYFPTAQALAAEIYPPLPAVEADFNRAGLHRAALDVVRVSAGEDIAAFVERLRMRASSFFERLTEREIEEGFARIDADLESGAVLFRPAEDGDLLVLALDGDDSPAE